jgi:DNA primase
MKASLEQAVGLYENQVNPAVEYLLGRGIGRESIESFRLGFVSEPISGHEQYQGCISIPSLGPSGVYGLRFRSLRADGPKYLGLSGAPTRLFNIRDIHTATDTICVTEGELDAVILSQCGLKATGVSGANSWKRHHPRMMAGFEKVYIFGDGDKAGSDFAKQVMASLDNGIRVRLPENLDVNEYFLKHGERGLLDLMSEMN